MLLLPSASLLPYFTGPKGNNTCHCHIPNSGEIHERKTLSGSCLAILGQEVEF